MEKQSFERNGFIESADNGEKTGLDSPPEAGKDEERTENDRNADLRPEFCTYRDEGCELADSCLECPFPECIYEPGGKQRWLKKRRAREIARLSTGEGKNVREIAAMFGISERTVMRDLKMVTDCQNDPPP